MPAKSIKDTQLERRQDRLSARRLPMRNLGEFAEIKATINGWLEN